MHKLLHLLAAIAAAFTATFAPGSQQATPTGGDPVRQVVVAPPPAPTELVEQLRVLGEGFDGRAGIAIRDIQAGWTASYNGDELLPQQSVSKLWVALAVYDAIDHGQMTLDEPMARYWVDPDIATDPRRERLTARLALNHQSGFPNWRPDSAGGRLAFLFDPGSAFGYSGEGYDYVGRFAEKRVGRDFESLAQQYVLGPAGMTSTSYSSRGRMRNRLAIPLDTAGAWARPQVSDSGHWSGANNLITTIGDYARFVVSVSAGFTFAL